MRLSLLDYVQFLRRGVSEPVAHFITAERHPIRNFDIFVRQINPQWDYYIPPATKDVLGLWDQNADAYARWKRSGGQESVLLYHDAPEHCLIAWTEQGLLAELDETGKGSDRKRVGPEKGRTGKGSGLMLPKRRRALPLVDGD